MKKSLIEIETNFDMRRIQTLFSNLSSLSLIELINLRDNYKNLNYSITGKHTSTNCSYIQFIWF